MVAQRTPSIPERHGISIPVGSKVMYNGSIVKFPPIEKKLMERLLNGETIPEVDINGPYLRISSMGRKLAQVSKCDMAPQGFDFIEKVNLAKGGFGYRLREKPAIKYGKQRVEYDPDARVLAIGKNHNLIFDFRALTISRTGNPRIVPMKHKDFPRFLEYLADLRDGEFVKVEDMAAHLECTQQDVENKIQKLRDAATTLGLNHREFIITEKQGRSAMMSYRLAEVKDITPDPKPDYGAGPGDAPDVL